MDHYPPFAQVGDFIVQNVVDTLREYRGRRPEGWASKKAAIRAHRTDVAGMYEAATGGKPLDSAAWEQIEGHAVECLSATSWPKKIGN